MSDPLKTDFVEALRVSFHKQTLMQTFGAEIDHVGYGKVSISAPILELARQQHGFGHAGLTFSLGDVACGYAASTVTGPGMGVLTAEMKINLVNPARGDSLIARAEVVKPGRRLVVARADVFAVDQGVETLIAVLLGTIVPVPDVAERSKP